MPRKQNWLSGRQKNLIVLYSKRLRFDLFFQVFGLDCMLGQIIRIFGVFFRKSNKNEEEEKVVIVSVTSFICVLDVILFLY